MAGLHGQGSYEYTRAVGLHLSSSFIRGCSPAGGMCVIGVGQTHLVRLIRGKREEPMKFNILWLRRTVVQLFLIAIALVLGGQAAQSASAAPLPSEQFTVATATPTP